MLEARGGHSRADASTSWERMNLGPRPVALVAAALGSRCMCPGLSAGAVSVS